MTISGNTVYDNYGIAAKTSSHTGNGIVVGQAGSGAVQNNVAYHNGRKCTCETGVPAANRRWDSVGLVFQFNTAYGDGFDLDGGATDCAMQYNYYKISQGNATAVVYAEIYTGPNFPGNRFFNDTLYAAGSALANWGGRENVYVNNIFATSGTQPVVRSSGNYARFMHNDYYAAGGR